MCSSDLIAPVTLLCIVPFLLIVRPGLDVNSAADVIAYAKANPAKLSFASAGATSGPRMAGELFKLSAGISMTHVPYRGAALAITDVMAGHVDLMFADMGSAAAFVKGGKVRAIGIASPQRAAAFSDPNVSALAQHVQQGIGVVAELGGEGICAAPVAGACGAGSVGAGTHGDLRRGK